MSDYVLKEEGLANAMTSSFDEVKNEAENSQYSLGEESNSATRDSSFLLLKVENSQSGSMMVSNSTPPNSDQVFSASQLDDVPDQHKLDENSKHALKKALTATADSNSDQQLTNESNSNVDSVSYQPEAETEKPMPTSATRKVSDIVSALDPKKSKASSEFPRVQETVYHETPPPVDLISARIPPEIPPPVDVILAKNSPDISLDYASDDVSEHSEHSVSSEIKRTRKIPSYMAATVSAKAKVRSQSLPKQPRPEDQEKKRNPFLGSYGKPPPFHETLRTPERSISQVHRTTHRNDGSISFTEATGFSEKSKREWRS